MNEAEDRRMKELQADEARRRVASDVQELARSGDALIEKSHRVAKLTVPLLVGVAVAGGLFLARRAFRPRPIGFSRGPSFTRELLRRATLSFLSVAVARWTESTPLLGPVPARSPSGNPGDRDLPVRAPASER